MPYQTQQPTNTAPTPQATGGSPPSAVAKSGPDATAEFYQTLQDPRRWVIKQGVPIFKSHQRKDPNTGALIKVDPTKLQRIAANMQRLERDSGVPIRMTLGHTEPGKPETQQPPVAGYYRNPRVQPFGPKGEPAIVVDEWLDPQYVQNRKNFPYRSSEYYDDAEQITGVALLTRDPFLDLGIVAYSRLDRGESLTTASKGPVLYHSGHPSVPYRFLIGDSSMWPTVPGAPGYQQQPPFAAVPQQVQVPQQPTPPQVPAQYANPQPPAGYNQPQQPQVPAAPQPEPQQPTNYGNYRTPYRSWPGPAHSPPSMNRSHPSGGAIYGRNRQARYANDPMTGDMGGGDPMMKLEQLHELASALLEEVEGVMSELSPAPTAPFPGEGGPDDMGGTGTPPPGEGPPIPASRYAAPMGRPGMPPRLGARPGLPPRRPAGGPMGGRPPVPGVSAPGGRPPGDPSRPAYSRYDRAGQQTDNQTPTPNQGQPMRTISGLPVGYQMELDKRDRKIRDMEQAMQVIFYERDQADTEACVAEISRLAAMGFAVSEYEVSELKAKPRDQRAAYIQHIMTKYQRVGTEMPPALLGDPTPGPLDPNDNPGRPLSREEMDAALKLAEGNSDPNAFMQAVQYIRSGGNQPTQYGHNRIAGYPQVNLPNPAQVGSGMPTPSQNGQGY